MKQETYMMNEIPSVSWKSTEKVLLQIGSNEKQDVNKNNTENSLTFLKSIFFVDENDKLTKIGESYYYERFVYNDSEGALEILTSQLKELKSVQLICQNFWGRQNVKKENILHLFVIHKLIKSISTADIGTLLSILNKCKIISYNKNSGNIKVLYNPNLETEPSKSLYLSPEKPYTNILHFRQVLQNCEGHIWWFDKHFEAKGLVPLSEVVDGSKINEIKILSGISHINEKIRNDFKRFKQEMSIRGIRSEFRIILDKKTFHDHHDRWLISENVTYNIPPVNTIYKGQHSEINITPNSIPFQEWWESAKDIISDWNTIMTCLKDK
jgi:hypothetical protein